MLMVRRAQRLGPLAIERIIQPSSRAGQPM